MFAVDVPRLLETLGVQAKKRGRLWLAKCPNPAHPDKDPSWRIVDDPGSERHGSHNCFACGFGGGPWELVAAVRDMTLEDAGLWFTDELLGRREAEERDLPRVVMKSFPSAGKARTGMQLPWGVQIPSLDGTSWFPPALAYLESRGIPLWQIERWHVGFATRGRCRMRVFVPVVTRGVTLSYVARAFIKDDRMPRYDAARRDDQGAEPDVALFGEPAFEPLDGSRRRGVATVTEGVFKAMAMERAGAPNPCAILGASNLGPEKISMLATFRTLLVATDPDRAGEKAFEEIWKQTARWCDVRRVPLEISPDDASDEQNEAAWRSVA